MTVFTPTSPMIVVQQKRDGSCSLPSQQDYILDHPSVINDGITFGICKNSGDIIEPGLNNLTYARGV